MNQDNKKQHKYATISVIIPVLNEELYLSAFLNSLLAQDYPREYLEYIFVDGGSTDASIDIIHRSMGATDRSYKILDNLNKTAPYAMNIGIRASIGKIIVRLDVHSEYPKNYISKCVYYLQNTDADNVGCPRLIRGRGFLGECIERVLTSKFGVGNSDYRMKKTSSSDFQSNETDKSEKKKYVDTVPLGTFYKKLFDEIGFFDENYPRAEDNEINMRIRSHGKKVLQFEDIYTVYYCRNTLRALVKMAYGNGGSVAELLRDDPDLKNIKYLIPGVFFLSIVVGVMSSLIKFISCRRLFLTPKSFYKVNCFISILFMIELTIYGFCGIYSCYKSDLSFIQKVVTFFIFPVFHISYGVGVVRGLTKSRHLR